MMLSAMFNGAVFAANPNRSRCEMTYIENIVNNWDLTMMVPGRF